MTRCCHGTLMVRTILAACVLLVTGWATADDPDAVLPRFTIPSAIDPEVVAGVSFYDFVNVKHGIGMSGAIARSSEFGHENYRNGELNGEYMRIRGELWLAMVREITDTFWEFDGTIAPALELTEIGLVPAPGMRLEDYANAAYAYHLHHRGPRWAGEGHEETSQAITTNPQILAYFTSIGRHVLDHHYVDGRIVHTHMNDDHPGHDDHGGGDHDPGTTDFDAVSMSHGLAAIQAPIYAYVRWASPEGVDDMGQVAEAQLAAWLGYSIDELVMIARDIAAVLDQHWAEDVGAYDFGDGTRYELHTLGALLKGHKGLYEALAIFGGEEDLVTAAVLAERAAAMLEPIVFDGVAQDWGLPTHVEYTTHGVRPASGTVSVARQWEFVTRITGGFSITRERPGEQSAMLLTTNAPALMAALGEFTDRLLIGALNYQLDDQGLVVTELDYFTGRISDARYTPAALGSFLTGTGNIYRSHEAVVRPSDWDSVDEETRALSERFHDLYVRNAEFMLAAFVLERTW